MAYKKLSDAMSGKAAPAKKPASATIITGGPVKQGNGPSKDPAIQAEIAKRMAAQKAAEAEEAARANVAPRLAAKLRTK